MEGAPVADALARCQGVLDSGTAGQADAQPHAVAALHGFKQGMLRGIAQVHEAAGQPAVTPGMAAVQNLTARAGGALTGDSIAAMTGMGQAA